MKRTVALSLVICMLGILAVPAWADAGTPLNSLKEIEVLLYGKPKAGALVERLDELEMDVFGAIKPGPILVRIESLNSYLLAGAGTPNSLQLKLSAVEWLVYEEVSTGEPLYTRLDKLEGAMYGFAQEGTVIDRADNLLRMVWASDKLNVDVVTVPKETLVRIKLLTDLDSSKSKVGDNVRYRVLDDVMIKDRLVIPAGTEGIGKVSEVTTAKRLGVDGRILVDFGSLPAIDGSPVSLIMEEKATERNKSLELAAGAGMAGVILLGGPIGLAGAWFVKGKDVVIPMGAEFYVEVMRDTRVSGLSLTPAR